MCIIYTYHLWYTQEKVGRRWGRGELTHPPLCFWWYLVQKYWTNLLELHVYVRFSINRFMSKHSLTIYDLQCTCNETRILVIAYIINKWSKYIWKKINNDLHLKKIMYINWLLYTLLRISVASLCQPEFSRKVTDLQLIRPLKTARSNFRLILLPSPSIL